MTCSEKSGMAISSITWTLQKDGTTGTAGVDKNNDLVIASASETDVGTYICTIQYEQVWIILLYKSQCRVFKTIASEAKYIQFDCF